MQYSIIRKPNTLPLHCGNRSIEDSHERKNKNSTNTEKVSVVYDPIEDRCRLCIVYSNFMEYFCYITDFSLSEIKKKNYIYFIYIYIFFFPRKCQLEKKISYKIQSQRLMRKVIHMLNALVFFLGQVHQLDYCSHELVLKAGKGILWASELLPTCHPQPLRIKHLGFI